LQSSKSAIEQINQVASAIEEQSTTSEQISQNVTSINMVTNENAHGISQIVLAAEDLNSLTSNLYEIVNKFKIVEDKTVKDNKYFNVGKN
jgi:methyl-accepting chemotaxis protein